MNINGTPIFVDIDDAPSAAELAQEDELRARHEANRPNDEFSASNQDPWLQ